MKLIPTLIRSSLLLTIGLVSTIIGPGSVGHRLPQGLRHAVTVVWQVASPSAFAEAD